MITEANHPQGVVVRRKVRAEDRQVAGSHYKDMGVQPWAVIDTWPLEQQVGFHRGTALAYLMRMGSKDDRTQEAHKAGHCLEKLIEVLEAKPES